MLYARLCNSIASLEFPEASSPIPQRLILPPLRTAQALVDTQVTGHWRSPPSNLQSLDHSPNKRNTRSRNEKFKKTAESKIQTLSNRIISAFLAGTQAHPRFPGFSGHKPLITRQLGLFVSGMCFPDEGEIGGSDVMEGECLVHGCARIKGSGEGIYCFLFDRKVWV